MSKHSNHYFDHETYDVYRLAREVAKWLRKQDLSGSARKQLLSSSESMVLNIAEGLGRKKYGGSMKSHLSTALGSAAETCAGLDLLAIRGADKQQDKLRRVGAMLHRMQQ